MADLDIAALRKHVNGGGDLPLPLQRVLLDAAEQLQAVRKALGGYPDSDLAGLATTLQAMASVSEKAQEQLQAVTAERDDLRRIDAVRLDQIKTLQNIIRGDLTPAGIEVAQWRQERDQLRAQRDTLLAAANDFLNGLAIELAGSRPGHWYSAQINVPDYEALQNAVRNCKETQ